MFFSSGSDGVPVERGEHGCWAAVVAIVVVDESSTSPLNDLNLGYLFICVGIPHCRAVLHIRSNKGGEGFGLCLLGAEGDVTTKEAKTSVSRRSNFVDMLNLVRQK